MSPVRYELGFYIPEDGILHSHRRENLKSYIVLTGWALAECLLWSPNWVFISQKTTFFIVTAVKTSNLSGLLCKFEMSVGLTHRDGLIWFAMYVKVSVHQAVEAHRPLGVEPHSSHRSWALFLMPVLSSNSISVLPLRVFAETLDISVRSVRHCRPLRRHLFVSETMSCVHSNCKSMTEIMFYSHVMSVS
jgi:hypothetical protein